MTAAAYVCEESIGTLIVVPITPTFFSKSSALQRAPIAANALGPISADACDILASAAAVRSAAAAICGLFCAAADKSDSRRASSEAKAAPDAESIIKKAAISFLMYINSPFPQ